MFNVPGVSHRGFFFEVIFMGQISVLVFAKEIHVRSLNVPFNPKYNKWIWLRYKTVYPTLETYRDCYLATTEKYLNNIKYGIQ